VLTGCTEDMAVISQETMGPVAAVLLDELSRVKVLHWEPAPTG